MLRSGLLCGQGGRACQADGSAKPKLIQITTAYGKPADRTNPAAEEVLPPAWHRLSQPFTTSKGEKYGTECKQGHSFGSRRQGPVGPHPAHGHNRQSVACYQRTLPGTHGDWQEHTEWHNLVGFQQTAEILRDYVRKGTRLYVEGLLRTRSWDDRQTGQCRYRSEIVVTEATDLLSLATLKQLVEELESLASQRVA